MFNLGNAKRNVLGEKINNNYDFFYSKDKYDINSKCDSHAAIARNVKEKSVVLDVGCASGNIGKILKDFKSATIDGIEYNEEALEIARKKNCYCNLYSFSITDKESKAYKIIRAVNVTAEKNGQFAYGQGKASKYIFAEKFGIPMDVVNAIIERNNESTDRKMKV